MNQKIRLVIAFVMLSSILLLARNHSAWASGLPSQDSVVEQNGPQSGVADSDEPGSVKPPPAVVPPITKPGNYSVGGVCTLNVITLAEEVSLHAVLLPFSAVGKPPKEKADYLAGVCSLRYHKSGKPMPDLISSDGNVEICFAALPNTTGQIYVYNNQDKTWTALETSLKNGLMCAVASKTGRYVLIKQP